MQFDNEANQLKNKKRKPRPSFLDQVQKNWSLKIPSTRENFPWQEQEIGEKVREFSSPSDVSSVEEGEKSSRASEPVRAGVEIRKSSAPWDHGSRNRNALISERSKNSAENGGKGNGVVEGHPRNEKSAASAVRSSENSVMNVTVDGKSERKFREFEKFPIESPNRSRSGGGVEEEEPPTVRRNVSRDKSSGGGDGLSKVPWERRSDEETVRIDKFRDKKTVLAERSIPEHELKRLRNVSLRMVERITVGAAGVTQELVNAIHEKWKDEEVVKLKFEGPPSKNMKRTHEFLEVTASSDIVSLLIILFSCS